MAKEIHYYQVAQIAADVMFSAPYYELLQRVYSNTTEIADFESDPKSYLRCHDINVPDEIDVVIHTPGAAGRPARVDFHWRHRAEAAKSTVEDLIWQQRYLAGAAWHFLHSPEMNALKSRVEDSPKDVARFAEDPRAFAAANGVTVPDGLEIVVHADEPGRPRIDVHFGPPPDTAMLPPIGGGCCYCGADGICCYYQEF